MKRKLSLLLAILMVVSVFAVGCAPKDEPAVVDTPKDVVDAPKEEGPPNPGKTRDGAANTLIVGSNEAKGEFIPVYYSTAYDGYIIDLLYDVLVTNNEAGEYIPSVATNWELSEDKKTYTFHMRDDVKFSDGTPLTAYDVEFTYLVMMDPNYDGRYSPTAALIEGYDEYLADKDGKLANVKGIVVEDDHTISFTFKEAMATNLADCAFPIMSKAHFPDYTKGNIDAIKAKMQDPMGSGMFTLENYEQKQFIEFKANPNYWDGAVSYDNLIYKFTTVETQISELQKGTIDIQIQIPAKPENKEMIDEPGFLSLSDYPQNSYGYIGFNFEHYALKDKNVRQALMYGFDRQAFVDLYYQGYGAVCNAPISQVSWAYTDKVNPYTYDPDKSIELLEASGWVVGADGIREKDGKKLDFIWDTYTDSKYVEVLIPMLKDQWSKIGVKVEPNLMEFNALVEKVYTDRESDMWNMAWSLTLDPDAYDIFHSAHNIKDGNNAMKFVNKQNDELLIAGRKEFDQAKRAEIYQEWAVLVNEELPYMFFTQSMQWDGYNTRVKNFHTGPYLKWTKAIKDITLE